MALKSSCLFRGLDQDSPTATIDTVGLDDLRRGVASGDLTLLARIPGVGKRQRSVWFWRLATSWGCQQIVLRGDSCASTTTTALREPVAAALEQLGWPRAVAERTLNELSGEFTSVEEMLRGALGVLGPSVASNIDDFDYLNTPAEEPEVSRIIAPDSDEIERAAEAALRPRSLNEFIGQPAVRLVSVVLDAARE